MSTTAKVLIGIGVALVLLIGIGVTAAVVLFNQVTDSIEADGGADFFGGTESSDLQVGEVGGDAEALSHVAQHADLVGPTRAAAGQHQRRLGVAASPLAHERTIPRSRRRKPRKGLLRSSASRVVTVRPWPRPR